MDELAVVGFFKALEDLFKELSGVGHREGAVDFEPVAEVHPLQVFHDHIEEACRGAPVVIEGDGMGVGQAAGVEDFTAEALDFGGVGGDFGEEEFDGYVALNGLLAGEEDDAKAAAANFTDDAVASCCQITDFGKSW